MRLVSDWYARELIAVYARSLSRLENSNERVEFLTAVSHPAVDELSSPLVINWAEHELENITN